MAKMTIRQFKKQFRSIVKHIDGVDGLSDEQIIKAVTDVLEEYHR